MGGDNGSDERTLPIEVRITYAFRVPSGKEYKVTAVHQMIDTPINGGGPMAHLAKMDEAVKEGNARCLAALAKLIELAQRGNWEQDPFMMALEELQLGFD